MRGAAGVPGPADPGAARAARADGPEPADAGPSNDSSSRKLKEEREQEERRQLAALMVQAPASVHTALVRLLEGELAGVGEGSLQEQEPKEEEEAIEQEEEEETASAAGGAGQAAKVPSSVSSPAMIWRAMLVLAALQAAPTLMPRSPRSDPSSYPFYDENAYDDEPRSLADALAAAGLMRVLLRLMKRHPTAAVIHRLACPALIWLPLRCNVCPLCDRGCSLHYNSYDQAVVAAITMLADAIATFRTDPKTLAPVLGAFVGVVSEDRRAAAAVVDGKGTVSEIVGILGRLPSGE